MIGRPEYTLSLPPPCPTNRDHLRRRRCVVASGPPGTVPELPTPGTDLTS